ncbi:MAG: flavin reductase family protein [Sedimentisphaerales bacterium]|nr:flavin reductase family protein [Sedimentisphaerales bacterium]
MQKQVEFTEAVKTKYPEQTIVAVAKDSAGKANPITLGWTMFASGSPPMMAIAVAKGHYSVKAIEHSKCFTIAYPSADMVEDALFFGSRSGRDTDKFAQSKCRTEPAKQIDSVLLLDAVANFECVLESQMAAGDHMIYVGRVVAAHVNTQRKKRLYTVAPGHKLGAVMPCDD